MSRTRKAVVASSFTIIQIGLAAVSGFVLFPLIVHRLGPYNNGLWLATGELVGYLGLSELGVFAVLPWLVSACDSKGDHKGVAQYLSDAIGMGCFVGLMFLIASFLIWNAEPALLGIASQDFATIRTPLVTLLALTAASFPLRAFAGVLSGLQDFFFIGVLSIAQTGLTIVLTASLILADFGMLSLAVAAGAPPILHGIATAIRLHTTFPEVSKNCGRPRLTSCRSLLAAGVGAFLGGIGVRLLTATSGLVYASVGRPSWATLYSATGKVAHVAQPICTVIPDSGLIGLSQIAAGPDDDHARRTALCIVLLHLLIPGFVAVGFLTANAWFIGAWLGDEYYAGNTVNVLIVANLLIGSAVSGLFKVVAVVGHRVRIGAATVLHGALAATSGYLLTRQLGISGLPLAFVVTGILFAVPFGLASLRIIYQIGPRELIIGPAGRWAMFTIPLLIVAAWLGTMLRESTLLVLASATLLLLATYMMCARQLIADMPWPEELRTWLTRMRLVSGMKKSTLRSPKCIK